MSPALDGSAADEEILDRLRRGDEPTFAQIVDAWAGRMRRRAVAYVAGGDFGR